MGASKTKFDARADFEVRLALAPRNCHEKLIFRKFRGFFFPASIFFSIGNRSKRILAKCFGSKPAKKLRKKGLKIYVLPIPGPRPISDRRPDRMPRRDRTGPDLSIWDRTGPVVTCVPCETFRVFHAGHSLCSKQSSLCVPSRTFLVFQAGHSFDIHHATEGSTTIAIEKTVAA